MMQNGMLIFFRDFLISLQHDPLFFPYIPFYVQLFLTKVEDFGEKKERKKTGPVAMPFHV